MLMIATSIPYFAYIMKVSSTDYVANVGELTYSFEMKAWCMFTPATVIPLIFLSLFSLINIQDSKTSNFSLLVRSYLCLGSNVFWIRSCLMDDFIYSLALFSCCFRPALHEICIFIVNTTVSCSSTDWLKNICASEFNVPWFFICAISVSYFETIMDGM